MNGIYRVSLPPWGMSLRRASGAGEGDPRQRTIPNQS